MIYKLKKVLPVILILPAFFPFYYIISDFFSPDDFLSVLNSDTVYILKNTLIQSFLSTVLCFLFAIGPSLYIKNTREDNFLSKIIRFTFFVPYYYPVVSVVISFSIIFNIVFSNFRYTLFTIFAAHLFYNTPIMIKHISSSIVKIEKEIIESSRLECKNNYQILFLIIFGIISKSLMRGAFIVFTFCFMSFGIILALGSIKYSNFEVSIFTALNSRVDFSEALTYGIIQIIIISIFNFFISLSDNSEFSHENYPDKNSSGIVETFCALLFTFYEFIILTIPFISFIFFSIKNRQNYIKTIFSKTFNTDFPVINGIINSITVSIITAAIVTIMTYFFIKKGGKSLEFIITSIFAISPALLSTAYIYIMIIYDIHPYFLLIAGFVVITIPYSYSLMLQHVKGFNKSILESARLETKSILRKFLYIEWPILSPIFILSFLNIFAVVYGEFTFSYIFSSGENFSLISAVNYSISSRRLMGETYALNAFNTFLIFAIFTVILSLSLKNDKSGIAVKNKKN